jgi:hypothetical protein
MCVNEMLLEKSMKLDDKKPFAWRQSKNNKPVTYDKPHTWDGTESWLVSKIRCHSPAFVILLYNTDTDNTAGSTAGTNDVKSKYYHILW